MPVEAGTAFLDILPRITSDFARKLERGVQPALKRAGQATSRAGAQLTRNVTLPLVGLGTVAVQQFGKVNSGLREVITLTGRTGAEADATFDRFQGKIAELSDEVGIAQGVLVDGLYNALSAGVPEDRVFDFLETAARAGIAGVTDTATAVDGLTTVLNAFGLDADQTETVAASMFQAVRDGKTTFDELSNSLFQVAPIAAGLNVPFEDINAALAALTSQGVPTSVASTQIRGALAELAKEGSVADKAFRDLTGQGFGNFIAQGGSVREAFDIIRAGADESGGSVVDYFGSIEAGQAVLGLTGEAAAKFGETLENQGDATEDAAGTIDDAFSEVDKGRALERLGVRLQNLAIQIGEVLLPVVEDVVAFLVPLIEGFGDLPDPVKANIVALGGLVAALGPVLFVGGKLVSAIGGMVGAFAKLVAFLPKVMTAIRALFTLLTANPYVALIAATIAIGVLIFQNWDKIKAFLATTWEAITNAISVAWGAIRGFFARFWPAILVIFTGGLGAIVLLVVSKWDEIKAFISGALSAISGFVTETFSAVVSTITGALTEARDFVVGAWETITGAFEAAVGAISDAIAAIADAVVSQVDRMLGPLDEVAGAIGGVVGGLGDIAGSAISKIPGLAAGGTVTDSGAFFVGEEGPELLNLPRGATVTPLDRLAGRAAGGGDINLGGVTVINPVAEPLATTLPRVLRREAFLAGRS